MTRGRGAGWRQAISRDVVYAVKAMRRAPGFTLATVATIALGVGANAAVFGLLRALLLQPLDAERPEELVRIYTSEGRTLRHERDLLGGSSYADLTDLRSSPALAGIVAYMPISASIRSGDAVSGVPARAVSADFFDLLGRPLFLGGWRAGHDAPGADLEVVVSHEYWRSSLGGDRGVVGRPLLVNGQRATIAGVTAAGFRGIEPAAVDLYVPLGAAPALTGQEDILTDRGARLVRLLGRLAAGTSASSAEASLEGIMRGLGEAFPSTNAGRRVAVREARSILPLETIGAPIGPMAGLAFAASLVVLAISGVNVAAVLLARALRRRRELAIRLTLGAAPRRIVGQLLTESLVLALAAGILAAGLVSLLPLLAGTLGVPASVRPTIDGTVLAYAITVALACGALFGILPAMAGMQPDVVESLRAGGAGGAPPRARAQRVLVVAQVALSMLLLLVSGGLLGTLQRQQAIDPGFSVSGLVVATFEDPAGRTSPEAERVLVDLARERLGALPGVTAVSVSTGGTPLTSDGASTTIGIPGYEPQPGESMDLRHIVAGPDFFRAVGIPLRRGRELTWRDLDTLSRVVINEAMALRYFGTRDPVGSYLRLPGYGMEAAEVIGVSADARFRSLGEAPVPHFVLQRPVGGGSQVLVRTDREASALLLAVRGTMARSDVPMMLVSLRTMEDVVRQSLAIARAVSRTLLAIGVLALLLSAVGLFGVVSHVMTGRTREFGVRLALGATPGAITRLVLAYGLRLAAVGAVLGVVLGFGALVAIAAMIPGSWDSRATGAASAIVLIAVTLAACVGPSVRAMRTSPAEALRAE